MPPAFANGSGLVHGTATALVFLDFAAGAGDSVAAGADPVAGAATLDLVVTCGDAAPDDGRTTFEAAALEAFATHSPPLHTPPPSFAKGSAPAHLAASSPNGSAKVICTLAGCAGPGKNAEPDVGGPEGVVLVVVVVVRPVGAPEVEEFEEFEGTGTLRVCGCRPPAPAGP